MMKKIILFLTGLFIIPLNIKAISASSYAVMDMDNERVLLSSNKDSKRLIASISKVMTCIIALENGNLNETVTVDENILKVYGSSIYLEIGEKIKLKDLIYGMMMRSGNDAAMMIAINIAGSMDDFSRMMNEYAKKIGMDNTYFYNSHGLEEKDGMGNISTAYDMCLLTTYAMKNKTFQKVFGTKEYLCKSNRKTYHWYNKNKLLKEEYITGGKTGYTLKAHRTLITTATINKMNIVIVTLNDSNDWQDHLNLYKTIKRNYEKIKILDKNNFSIIDENIFIKEKLYIKKNVYVTLSKNERNNINIKYYLVPKKKYDNNDMVGYAKVYLNDIFITSQKLYIKGC